MAENIENNGCPQRDNAEHEGYAEVSRPFNRIWKERDNAQPGLLEAILDKDNLNRAYKRVKANKGVAGIDGMTVEEALPYLRGHQQELIDRIYRGKYTPSPVRGVEIPKSDGGVRKLGIPTVTDRTIQQAIAQQLMPIYEPLFADGSYGYRPNRSAKDAITGILSPFSSRSKTFFDFAPHSPFSVRGRMLSRTWIWRLRCPLSFSLSWIADIGRFLYC